MYRFFPRDSPARFLILTSFRAVEVLSKNAVLLRETILRTCEVFP